VHLESHATPLGESPQQRYASLHRAIERGLASDELWNELATVCHALGNRGEALHCLHRIRDDALRTRAEQAVLGAATAATRHTVAPAASIAGSRARARASQQHQEQTPGFLDHVVDAGQFLAQGQMPALALCAMLAFPLVFGIGGLVAAGHSPLLLAAVATLPTLCVLAVVAGMAREVLLRSSQGGGDPPGLPGAGPLLAGALRSAAAVSAAASICLGPAALLFAFRGPPGLTLAAATVGALTAPLMAALLQVRGDWRPCSPVFVARALSRAGRGYPLVAAAVTVAFAPVVGALWLVADRPVWMQIACAGPLLVLPLFAAARLLGTWLDSHRSSLGGFVCVESGDALVAPRIPRRRHAAPPRARRTRPAAPAAAGGARALARSR